MIDKYLSKKLIKGPWKLFPKPDKKYNYALVIPVYNELEYIDTLVSSINVQDRTLLDKTAIVFVINNSDNDKDAIIINNKHTIKNIVSYRQKNFFIVDASSFGNEFKEKIAGVGTARKIGADLILSFMNPNSILLYTDADVILDNNYLSFIDSYFTKNNVEAAVVGFRHQHSNNNKINLIVSKYEDYLNETAKKIRETGSPYGYVSIGSCMVCRFDTYIAVGGMNKRRATEDFYFLNELSKYCNVQSICKVLVYPSSRSENRVHLGTGFHISRVLSGDLLSDLYFSEVAFVRLKELIRIVNNSFGIPYNQVDQQFMNLGAGYEFLGSNNISIIWDKLQKDSKKSYQFINQFNRWFDGLKTIKFLKLF